VVEKSFVKGMIWGTSSGWRAVTKQSDTENCRCKKRGSKVPWQAYRGKKQEGRRRSTIHEMLPGDWRQDPY